MAVQDSHGWGSMASQLMAHAISESGGRLREAGLHAFGHCWPREGWRCEQPAVVLTVVTVVLMVNLNFNFIHNMGGATNVAIGSPATRWRQALEADADAANHTTFILCQHEGTPGAQTVPAEAATG